jgi:hypothetical protein
MRGKVLDMVASLPRICSSLFSSHHSGDDRAIGSDTGTHPADLFRAELMPAFGKARQWAEAGAHLCFNCTRRRLVRGHRE